MSSSLSVVILNLFCSLLRPPPLRYGYHSGVWTPGKVPESHQRQEHRHGFSIQSLERSKRPREFPSLKLALPRGASLSSHKEWRQCLRVGSSLDENSKRLHFLKPPEARTRDFRKESETLRMKDISGYLREDYDLYSSACSPNHEDVDLGEEEESRSTLVYIHLKQELRPVEDRKMKRWKECVQAQNPLLHLLQGKLC